MNLKSLLIGSAAALVAAPAFAADVIIAEPEPVEYVEVCDVAGAGYFYIPGSRTCLKIGGLVRHQLDFDNQDFDRDFVVRGVADGTVLTENNDGSGIESLVRAELTIATFTETELGDLTSFIKFRANSENANDQAIIANVETGEQNIEGVSDNNATFLQEATIGLGGLLLGLTDTLYDGGINGEFDSGGGDRVHTIRYTADLGAFSASLGLEAELETQSRFNYVPNVTGKLSGDLGAFSVDLFAAYDDEDDIDFSVVGTDANGNRVVVRRGTTVFNDDEFALKLRLGADFGPATIQALATYNSGLNYYDNGYEYSAGASAKFGLGEKASVTFGGQYFANALTSNAIFTGAGTAADPFVAAGNGSGTDVIDGADGFSVGANVDYEIVDGFDVKIAVNYLDKDTGVRALVTDANGVTAIRDVVSDDDGFFEGFIRFDRSF